MVSLQWRGTDLCHWLDTKVKCVEKWEGAIGMGKNKIIRCAEEAYITYVLLSKQNLKEHHTTTTKYRIKVLSSSREIETYED